MISVEDFFKGEGYAVLPQDTFGKFEGRVHSITEQSTGKMSYGMKLTKTSDVNNMYKVFDLVEFGEFFGHDALIIRREGDGYVLLGPQEAAQEIASTIAEKLVKGRKAWVKYEADPENVKEPKPVILGSERFSGVEEIDGEIAWLSTEFEDFGLEVDWDDAL